MTIPENYDFVGWATKHNMRCSDGRVIQSQAFKHQDGAKVPLMWNHQHSDVEQVIGHAILKHEDDGVKAYCYLNDTTKGQVAKALLHAGDIDSLSIFANQLQENGSYVVHGKIQEVSVVISGANPGASITEIAHCEEGGIQGVICTGETLIHSDPENQDKTLEDVYNSMTEEQKQATCAMIGMALNDQNKGGNSSMQHNAWDPNNIVGGDYSNTISHADARMIFSDIKHCGTLKGAISKHADRLKIITHSDETAAGGYGIENIEYLFPDAKNVTNQPLFIRDDDTWVGKILNGVHKSPFSRVKSLFADITEDEARARGYIKGNRKKEEAFTLLKRVTEPQTIYKKQKLDRDDIADIVDFDILVWVHAEMKIKFDEEFARAILIGDGRMSDDEDKIKEDRVRPIWKDDDLFTVKWGINMPDNVDDATKADKFIDECVKSRKKYKGSGNPTMFTTEDMLTACLLLKDKNGRYIYETTEKLAAVLRVKEIITVPQMEEQKRTDAQGRKLELLGIYVNLVDYNVGTDKGGRLTWFDQFDIDYNQQKYLVETRSSGALIKPFAAVVIERIVESSEFSEESANEN